MNFSNYCKILLGILSIVAATFLIPIITALAYAEYNMLLPFIIPMISVFVLFGFSLLFNKGQKITLSTKSSFVIVGFAWVCCSLFGSLPMMMSGYFPTITDAVFESVSGFTTTGTTVLSDVEILPKSLNLWRCQTHWLGGMGIVALTVALFPLLGVGGFQLIKAETTGPDKGKVTAKITNTAKALWLIYLTLTVILTILLRIFGMTFIDALSHAFSTLGSGGFSTKNASIGYFNSKAIDWICTIFMFIAGINFSLIFYAFTGKFEEIKKNSEFKTYVGIVLIVTIILAFVLRPVYGGFFKSLRYAAFQVTSIISTTGFSTADYSIWIPAGQFLIFILFFIGGSSGSTGGGVKVVRWVVLNKQLKNEILRMLHPHGIYTIRLNGTPGRKDVVFSVTSFMAIYVFFALFITFAGTCANLDLLSAFTGSLSMLGNVGPAFGLLNPSSNAGILPDGLKWVYCFAMLAGRLELYTMVMFLVPEFWKK